MPAPLITAVMQRSMQSYLEREVGIPSGAAEYSRALIDQGYETPELFHQISDADLKKKFKWKDGHIKALNLYLKENPDIKGPKKKKKQKRKRLATGPSDKQSQYVGVSWNKSDQKWRVGIFHEGKKVGLGRFDDEVEAAEAYDTKARELKGAGAKLNFPGPGEKQGIGRMLRAPEDVAAAKMMGSRRSSYRGVCWDKQPGKWKAQIKEKTTGKVKHLGLFIDEEDAAQAYDDAERTMSGADAKLNFPAAGEQQARPRTTRTKEEVAAAKNLPPQKSKHRGVTWDGNRGKWKCSIKHKGGHKYLGRFDDEQEAADAYNAEAEKLQEEGDGPAVSTKKSKSKSKKTKAAAPPVEPPPSKRTRRSKAK